MAALASAVFHSWRARCLAVESTIEAALAEAAAGKRPTSTILLLAPALHELVSVYDDDDLTGDNEIRSLALQFKDVAERLAELLASVPEASGLAPLQQEIEGVAEDLALSVGSKEAQRRLRSAIETGDLIPFSSISARAK